MEAGFVSLQDRKQKRQDEANRPPADSAADAARHMLVSKVSISPSSLCPVIAGCSGCY